MEYEEAVAVGDRVRLRVSDGQWPRILELEKLPEEQGKGKGSSHKSKALVSPGPQKREETIARLSCARTAAVALSQADIPEDEREERLLELATKLEAWVKRNA